ncbi:glycosyltransferase [Rhodococcus sp. NPDC047139]|uniref:glycosyltransferase n=1 Tax=Rhodococcus sp. NPDC047139 TaxID=3155141 RepID=UPI0033FC0D53
MRKDEPRVAISPTGSHGVQTAVSVVIPTTGRASLPSAVQSVLDQVGVTVEVIVAMNGGGDLPDLPADNRVRVLTLQPGVGANVARHQGILSSQYPILALLDDDDLWLPTKLITQLRMVDEKTGRQRNFVVGCRIAEPDADVTSTIRPTVVPECPIASVAEYLFRRDTLKSRRPQLQSSTLVFPRDLYQLATFDGAVPIHQDWEWILKAEKAGASILLCPDVLALCDKGNPASITSATKWWQSVRWAQSRLSDNPILMRDFILTIALRFALRGGSLRGSVTCLCLGLRPALSNWRSSAYALVQFIAFAPAQMAKVAYRYLRNHRHVTNGEPRSASVSVVGEGARDA